MTTNLKGSTVTLRPTEGGYQKEKTGTVVHDTPKRIKVYVDGVGVRTFNKSDGMPATKADAAFPRYVVILR